MHARQARLIATAAAACAILQAAPLQAQVNWIDGTGFWDVPGNWSGGVLPGINDDVIINVGGLPTVTYQTITSTIRSLVITNATFSVESGTLDVTNTYTSNSATNISGGGLNLNGASTLATLSLTGGALGGTGTVTISGLANWTSGTMTGPGVTNANGGMGLGGDGIKSLDGGRVLNTAGTTTWSGATGDFTNRIFVGGDSTINNNGTWLDQNTFATDIAFNGGTNAFNNLGTYTKSGAAATSVGIAFNNTGTVNVNAGTLGLSGGGTSSGTFNVGAGDTLEFIGGTYVFSATSSITGGTATSNVVFSSGTSDFNGTYSVVGTTTLSGGTLNFNPASTVNSVGALSISGGSVNFSSGNLITPTTFSFSGGTLAGSDTVTLANSFTWTNGTMTGPGVTNANGGMGLGGDGIKSLDGGRVLNTAGTTTWSGATGDFTNRIFVGGDSTINNNGTWLDQNTFATDIAFNGGTNAFNNLGTYTKSGAAATSVGIAFNNTGTVNVNAGTLGLSGGGTSSGTFNVGAGDTLEFIGGTYVFSATSSITGGTATSNVVFSSGTSDFNGTYSVVGTTTLSGGTLNFNPASTVNSVGALSISGGSVNFSSGNLITPTTFSFSGGTLAGSDTVTLANSFTWTNGTMTGPGVTNANGGMGLGGDGIKSLDGGRVLNTAGTTTWSGATGDFTNRIFVGGDSTINNNGTWLDQNTFATDIAFNGGTNAFNNLGTYTKSGAAATSVGIAFNNTGTVNVNAGTMEFTSLQGTGTLQIGAAGTALLSSSNTTTGTLLHNGTAANSLVLGANTVTVSSDYNNANFGVGNAFNRRANVSTTGVGNQILAAGNVNQAITAGPGTTVNNGATTAPSIVVGNVRVGATSYTYNIANTGTTGPALRGAIQNAANGGNITDARLSGNGVLSSNWGPVAPGDSTARDITITINTAGVYAPIAGQAVSIVNNFENTRSQLLTISSQAGAAAFNPAAAAITPNPIMVANQRTGGTTTQALTIANAAPGGAFTEGLNAAFGPLTGDVNTNGGAINLLAGGASNNTAMRVGVNTATAGAKSGTIAVNFASDGTGTSGLPLLALPSQTVNVSGNVYQAAVGQLNTAPLNFGTVQVGQAVSQVLSISNIASGPLGFVEDLNASFGASSGQGAGQILGAGSIAGLLAGGTNASNMVVSVNTAIAGTINGSILVNYSTAGAVNGVSNGLGVTAAGSSGYGVQGVIQSGGQVVDQANPVINTPTIALGNVRVGGAVATQFVSVTNQASGNPQAALNASISTASGPPLTASGSFNLLNPGATNANSLQVSMGNTSAAGTRSGTATVAFVSDASNIGNCAPNCQLNLPSQNVNITGGVYQAAVGQLNTAPLNFGTVQVGQAVSQVLSISNIASGPLGFVEDLNASFGASSGQGAGQILGAGSIAGLLAGGTNASNMVVSVNTAIAGTINGSILVNYSTAGAVNGVSNGLGVTAAGSSGYGVQGVIQSGGQVVDQANPVINTPTIALGNVRVGGAVATQFVSVTNQASGNPQAALNASISTASGPPLTASGSFNLLNPGATNANSLQVSMGNTSAAGTRSGTATVAFVSDASNIGNCAPNCQLNLPSQNVNITGGVYQAAQPTFAATTISLAAARIGGTSQQAVTVTNTNIAPAGFQEGLTASIGGASAGITASGSFTNLAQGASNGTSILVGLNTATAGVKSGTAAVSLVSTGSGTSGLPDLDLLSQAINVSGNVYAPAVAQLNTVSVDFGIVRVGDIVAGRNVSVTNAALVQSLNDTLAAQFDSVSAPFTGSGSVAGLGAGVSNAAGSMTVGLNTGMAGVFDGSAVVGFASQNPEMADLGLGTEQISLIGQVNNLANPTYALTSGSGALTANGSQYVLDLGTLTLGSEIDDVLRLTNSVSGPADDLRGSFAFADPLDFGFMGWNAFSGLGAGQSLLGLGISFDALSLGFFEDVISLSGFSYNASDPNGIALDRSLIVRATVIQGGGTVPEPGTTALLILAGLLMMAARCGPLGARRGGR